MRTEKMISNWASALYLALEGKSASDRKKIMEKMVQIFQERKKEHLLPKVLKCLEKIMERKERMILVLGSNQSASLVKEIKNKLTNIFGKDKEVDTLTDRDIIGGFRLETENFLIKASIKDFLDSLKIKIY